MKHKTKLDLKYSVISIIDAIIILSFFFLTCDYVIQNVPDSFIGLLLIYLYAAICLLSCVIRCIHLLKSYYKELENDKENSKSKFYIYFFPLFAVVSCIISLFVIIV